MSITPSQSTPDAAASESPAQEMERLERETLHYEARIKAQILTITDEGFADGIVPAIELLLDPTLWGPNYTAAARHKDIADAFLRMVAIRDLEKGDAAAAV